MEDSPIEPITELLKDAYSGDKGALNDVMAAVYEELRRRAGNLMAKERPGHSLQPTELVHHAFMRLVNQRCDWQNRNHFYSIASTIMRRVLLDHARDRRALKRGGDRQREALDPERVVATGWNEQDFLALAEAVERLEKKDAQLANIVDMSLFGGMRYEDIASEMTVSVDEIEKDLKVATMMILRDRKQAGEESGNGGR
jgi:RNA polymerase sigma factor (TIGR02999 family)